MENKYQIYNNLTNVLYINMWGEAQRNNNIIYITNIENNIESKLCIRIARTVAQLNNVKVGVDCGFFTYIYILAKTKNLFKNKLFIRTSKGQGRAVEDWLQDVSNAYNEKPEIWHKVWEYLN